MTGVLWAAVVVALLISFASLALSALVASRYRQLHARVTAGSGIPGSALAFGPVFPAVGTPVPEFSTYAADGAPVGSDVVNQPGSVAVFVDTECKACKDMLPEIGDFLAERASAGQPPLAVISGDGEAAGEYVAALPEAVLVVGQPAGELARAFGVQTFPTVLVFDDGKVSASGPRPAALTAAAR
jgi:hypothetical protein